MKALLTTVFILLLYPISSFADSWSYEKKENIKKYKFGNINITHTIDARLNQQYPDYILKIENKKELLAQYRNVSFDNIFASKDNKTFVALSNDGLPGTAILVFNSKGDLKLEIKHDFGNFEYCNRSVTRVREWYSKESTGFVFVYNDENKITDMRLHSCKGENISLYKVIEKAYNKSVKQTD